MHVWDVWWCLSVSGAGELSMSGWHGLLGAPVPKDDWLQPSWCRHWCLPETGELMIRCSLRENWEREQREWGIPLISDYFNLESNIFIFVEFVEGPERLGLDECFFPTDEIGPWQEAFDALPNTPTFLMFGDIIHLISYEERLITDTAMPGLEAVRGLSSFTDVALNVELDKMMCKTTDSQLQVGERTVTVL